MKSSIVLGLIVILALPAAEAAAAPARRLLAGTQAGAPGRPGQAPPSGEAPQPTAADVQAWFDAMVVVQAQKALGLSDAQYPQFVGRLKALQDARRRNQRARVQIVQELGRLSNPANGAIDEAQLRDRLRALDDQDSRAAAEVRKAYDNLDQVLDIRQRARFRVFEEQIERRKFQFLLNARRGRGTTAPLTDR